MKGIVFTEFLEMVEQQFGYDTVDSIIEDAALPHDGIYVAGGTYPHTEMISLAGALSRKTGVGISPLMQQYGQYLFGRLISTHPQLAKGKQTALDFIAAVDNYIHIEVRKLYPDAELPRFEVIHHSSDRLEMDYTSSRHLQDLGVGLIKGCGEFYQTPLDIQLISLASGNIRFVIEVR